MKLLSGPRKKQDIRMPTASDEKSTTLSPPHLSRILPITIAIRAIPVPRFYGS
jgi:hypothetical protein